MLKSFEDKHRGARPEESAFPDGGADAAIDRITRLAAGYFSCPIAVITVVGKDWVSFRSRVGLDCDGVPRDGWF